MSWTRSDQWEYALRNFEAAVSDPVKWCCSGRCDDTNWMGHDRLHYRDATCPPYDAAEMARLVETARRLCGAP